MLNRNSKKLPKEDILSIKKTGKRLKNGYALTKLKRWKKEYAERKLRTTKAEEPKKTYAMNTERLKRAKQTIARRKRSKSMEERRQYWRKKNSSIESVGRKTKSTVKFTAKKATPSGKAMPTKQAISKVKMGEKKVSGEKKGVKGEKKQISSGRAMPTKQAISKVKMGEKKVSGEKKGVKGEKKQIFSGRAMPTKQAISKAKSQGIKKKSEKVGAKGEKATSSGRAMPIQNRAMVNKQIVEKIKEIEKPVEIKEIEKPVEVKEIEKPTIKEIAKESKGKVIVASLPKFTEENVEKVVKEVKSENKNVGYNIIENIVTGKNALGKTQIEKFYVWLEQKAEIKLQNVPTIKISLIDIVQEYKNDTNVYMPDDRIKNYYVLTLLCWYMYKDIIQSPYNIELIFNKINQKFEFEDYQITIPIYIISKEKKIKKLENLTWKTYRTLANNILKSNKGLEKRWYSDIVYFDNEDIVSTNAYKLLIMSKDWFNNETKNKLEPNTMYYENFGKLTTDEIGLYYPDYKKVLPDENNYLSHECIVEDEIQKCKLALLSTKFIKYNDQDKIKTPTTLTKFCFDRTYKSVTYNAQYMLDIMEIYQRLGITKFNFKYNKKFIETTTAITHSKEAIIIEAVNPKHFIYSLLMPNRRDYIEHLDINFSNEIAENYYNTFGLNDDINMSSEVQEIANDVLAFGDLFSDIDYTNEVQEIANDVPAFGDDITEEKIELDTEYDLPDVIIKRDDSKIASSKDIRAMKFKQMMLPSKYKSLLGKVPENFRLLLWGAPGHGKSSLALTIANDIGKRVKTLYVSAEESLESATLSSRIKRFKATSRNLMFNDTNNPEIIEKIIMTFNPKFIVIDSVNVILGKTEAIINLMLKYPNIGFIIIAQATKDRKRYAGLGSLAHAVDIVVNVKDGLATAEKNRYAQLGSMVVKGIKI